MKLTKDMILQRSNSSLLSEIESLDLHGYDISELNDCLSECTKLVKLHLNNNHLNNPANRVNLKTLKASLKWLNLSQNGMEFIQDLVELCKLEVLYLNHNNIIEFPSSYVKFQSLQALIVSDNLFKSLDCNILPSSLNTLILSHNKIEEIRNVEKLTRLKKLQLSHNLLRVIPKLFRCKDLFELRLNDNRIQVIQEEVIPLEVRIVDIGNNLLQNWTAISPLLQLRSIKNLNLKGNPLWILEGYHEKIVQTIPYIKTLDGKSLVKDKKAPKHKRNPSNDVKYTKSKKDKVSRMDQNTSIAMLNPSLELDAPHPITRAHDEDLSREEISNEISEAKKGLSMNNSTTVIPEYEKKPSKVSPFDSKLPISSSEMLQSGVIKVLNKTSLSKRKKTSSAKDTITLPKNDTLFESLSKWD